VTPLDLDLLRAWLTAEPANCAAALPRLAADERTLFLAELRDDDLSRLFNHAPVWWLASVLPEMPELPWPEAIERSGLNPNVLHTLRAVPPALRDALLARLNPRLRTRVNRALALPRDRVAGLLDEHIRACHADETTGAVAMRLARNGGEDAWVYVTDSNDRYLGQFTVLALNEATSEQRIADLPLAQRPRVPSNLLLADALRLANWRDYDSLPAVDDGGRFAGVIRLGALARALRIDDEAPEARPFNLVGSLLTLWTQLLVSVVSRADRTPAPSHTPNRTQ